MALDNGDIIDGSVRLRPVMNAEGMFQGWQLTSVCYTHVELGIAQQLMVTMAATIYGLEAEDRPSPAQIAARAFDMAEAFYAEGLSRGVRIPVPAESPAEGASAMRQFALHAIHQIEITSRCNLKCAYCPSYRLPRPKMDMTEETFVKALTWARDLHREYGHRELNLAGIGESTLHPRFVDWVLMARSVMGPNVDLVLATNGLLVTDGMAQAIAPARPRVWVSLHRPEKAQHAVVALKKAGILAGVSCDGALEATNWAGQIDWPVTTSAAGAPCDWVVAGKGIVLSDGRISRCCFDADGSGVFAHVDDDLWEARTSVYKLCETCHLKQREEVYHG